MQSKIYNKQTDAGRLTSEIIASGKSQYPTVGFRFYGVTVSIDNGVWTTEVCFADNITADEIAAVDVIVNNSIPVELPVESEFLKDSSGKLYVRSESRPLDCTSYFTSCGDLIGSSPVIGGGDRLEWDASVDTFFTEGVPTGFKRKYIDIQFCDPIYVKDGSVYGMGLSKGSYLDLVLICPPNDYFLYFGAGMQNTSSDWLIVDHYVLKYPMIGDNPAGHTLNTETCSQALPPNFKIRMIVTVPVADTTSYGYALLKMYRQRTVVL